MASTTFKTIGSRLPNGAVVMDATDTHVLAAWRGEFVVWTFDPTTGVTVNGNYDRSLVTATATFLKRAGLAA